MQLKINTAGATHIIYLNSLDFMSYFIRYAEIRDLDEDIVNLEVIFKSNSIIYHSFHQILYFFLSVFLLMTYHLSPKLVPY